MAADAEVQILISAVDNVSKEVQNIGKSLEGMQRDVNTGNKQLQTTFNDVTNNILVLGNAAQRVDSIFSSYQNIQLRLENASERVIGAQDRLATTQYELNKVMKDGKSTAEDIAEAKRKVEAATRSLTISQNNQARTQNMLIGTYINMGVQTVSLIAMLPKMTTMVQGLVVQMNALKMSTAGAGLAVTALGTAGIALAASFAGFEAFKLGEQLAEVKKAGGLAEWKELQIKNAVAKADELQAVKDAEANRIRNESKAQGLALYDVEVEKINKRNELLNLDLQLAQANTDKEREAIQAKIEHIQTEDMLNQMFAEQIKIIESLDISIEKKNELKDKEIAKNKELQKSYDDLYSSQSKTGYGGGGGGGIFEAGAGYKGGPIKQPTTIITGYDSQGNITSKYTETPTSKTLITPKKKKDFIVTKSGDIIEPDKNDTIMGFKGAIPTQGGQAIMNNISIFLDGQQIAYQVGRSVAEGLSVR